MREITGEHVDIFECIRISQTSECDEDGVILRLDVNTGLVSGIQGWKSCIPVTDLFWVQITQLC